MKTTKMVAAFVTIFALILGGCSPNSTNSEGNTTTTPLNGSAALTTTTASGDQSTTPGSLGTMDTTTSPDALTTTGTVDANLSTTGTVDPNQTTTGTVDANQSTTGTVDPKQATTGTVSTTGTVAATGTVSTTGTVDPKLTTTTLPGNLTSTPEMLATQNTTATPSGLTTTATPDAMGTPVPTTAATTAATTAPTTQAVIPVTGGSTGELDILQSSFEKIYNQVNPSVVYIEVVLGSASPNSTGSGSTSASGSGFVWDAQGHIVTNNHVINGATTVNVTFMDGTTATAKVVGQDPNADLAVIQVTVPAAELHPVTMGDSTKVKVGQIAIAIGNPFGLAGSMSEGIISALARSLPVESSNQNGSSNPMTGVYNIPNIIQTDAAINPGNSGGVLVNLQGEVIGVTAAIASQSQSNSGIGFVIPAEIVTKVVPALISTGKYAHPWLGVTGMTLSANVAGKLNLPATQRGALVIAVTPGGPAETAGLLPSTVDNTTGSMTTVGDIITAINGQPVRVFEDLGSYLFLQTKPGDVVTLTVMRGGKEQTVKVTLGTLPTP